MSKSQKSLDPSGNWYHEIVAQLRTPGVGGLLPALSPTESWSNLVTTLWNFCTSVCWTEEVIEKDKGSNKKSSRCSNLWGQRGPWKCGQLTASSQGTKHMSLPQVPPALHTAAFRCGIFPSAPRGKMYNRRSACLLAPCSSVPKGGLHALNTALLGTSTGGDLQKVIPGDRKGSWCGRPATACAGCLL